MGNCLVTKLKAVVDNPNLPYLDELTLGVVKAGNNIFGPLTFTGITIDDVDIRGDIAYCDSEGNVLSEKPSAFPFYVKASGSGRISVRDKMNITKLFSDATGYNKVDGIVLDLQDIRYLTQINELFVQSANVTGDVKFLENMDLGAMGAASVGFKTKVYGDLSYLPSALIFGNNNAGEGFTFSSGRRIGNKIPLFARNIPFKTIDDINRYMIDNAQCKFALVTPVTASYRKIGITSMTGDNTGLSNEAKAAIAMMVAPTNVANANSDTGYCWGIEVVINGTTYTSSDGINLDQ